MEKSFQKSEGLNGSVVVPGDKSISHRAAIIGAMAAGTSAFSGYSPAADCASTLSCLRLLGVRAALDRGNLHIEGRDETGFSSPESPLDAGNSGTTMRLLAGAVAGWPITVTLMGDASLLQRPMGRIMEPLGLMGARVEASDDRGRPPVTISGGGLAGIDYRPPEASAQVKSAVLLAGLNASGATTVREKVLTRDHTERMLQRMGIKVRRDGLSVTVEPGPPLGCDLEIPGDFSSAAFIITAALMCPGSQLTVRSVGLNPTRTGFLELLRRMEASLDIKMTDDDSWEPRGDVTARYGRLSATEISAGDVALAIDEVTLVALLATGAEGRTVIRGAEELRHKESDRIRGTVEGLSSMGATIEETDDGMVIHGPCRLEGATVESLRDHRLAMLFALAGLAATGRTVVQGWEWTDVSYPGFSDVLRDIGGRVV